MGNWRVHLFQNLLLLEPYTLLPPAWCSTAQRRGQPDLEPADTRKALLIPCKDSKARLESNESELARKADPPHEHNLGRAKNSKRMRSASEQEVMKKSACSGRSTQYYHWVLFAASVRFSEYKFHSRALGHASANGVVLMLGFSKDTSHVLWRRR